MELAQRNRDRNEFRRFLEKHRYVPQGRFARAGNLEDKDLDALLHRKLVPAWRWLWQNVKNAEDMENVRRNVAVARKKIESCRQERAEALHQRSALQARRQYLLAALQKEKEREAQLLHNLRTIETEQETRVQASMERKQREVLQQAVNLRSEKHREVFAADVAKVRQQMASARNHNTESDGSTLSDAQSSQNPVEILLTEYNRMNKNAAVAFGASDVEHVRGYGGPKLLQLLRDSAQVELRKPSLAPEEAQYANKIAEHSQSSHDALIQVQELLRQNQKKHIAKFLESQKNYTRIQHLQEEIAAHHTHSRDGLWNGSPQTIDGSERNMKDADPIDTMVQLEIQRRMVAAAMEVATAAYEEKTKEASASKKHKLDLDHRIHLMKTFSERQATMLLTIDATVDKNRALLSAMNRKQDQIQWFVRDHLSAKFLNKHGELVNRSETLTTQELRAFSQLSLWKWATTRRVALLQGGFRDGLEVVVPTADLYINQIQEIQQRDDTGTSRSNAAQRMFAALNVPTYGNWTKAIECLEKSHQAMVSRLNEQLNDLERELDEDAGRAEAHASSRVEELIGTLRNTAIRTEDQALQSLKQVVSINAETFANTLPELRQNIANWNDQPAWSVPVRLITDDDNGSHSDEHEHAIMWEE
ncbi:TPA: hypothetical protein N0F65_011435 [Lagenidium giganteum]|uniref:Uncharacterized protein n=1 Tax=Lagenidium giganteum TaxID=4803 RepID=A0AAV2ZBX6_9STRA|nr:TPA: hypothetical protein N0F65_011435 [Lagenidium giganteum]